MWDTCMMPKCAMDNAHSRHGYEMEMDFYSKKEVLDTIYHVSTAHFEVSDAVASKPFVR